MNIFDIKLDNLEYNSFLEKLCKLENQKIIFTPNPEILLKTQVNKEFKNLIQKADYLTPDGIGIYLAYQILDNNYWKIINTILIPYFFFNLFFRKEYLYKKYWDRICGSDITKSLLKYSQQSATKITIIDLYNPTDLPKVESQKKFPELLKKAFPKLDFDYFIYDPEKKDDIINDIKSSPSKIVFSTLWMIKQEKSVIEIIEKCPNIKLWLWIWSSFDYFIGFQKRAPILWRKLWLEWLYRLLTGPRKIDRLKRIYNAIFVFIYQVIKNKK